MCPYSESSTASKAALFYRVSPYTYYNIMRKSKDKKYLRHQMVIYAEADGIKETVRKFKHGKEMAS